MTEWEDTVISELKRISKLLTLAHSSQIEAELLKIASTDERKKMWVLIDGRHMSKDIARMVNVSERAVNYFLNQAASTGFAINIPRMPPTRAVDYVPPTWLDLIAALPRQDHESAEPVAGQSTNSQPQSTVSQKKLEEVE